MQANLVQGAAGKGVISLPVDEKPSQKLHSFLDSQWDQGHHIPGIMVLLPSQQVHDTEPLGQPKPKTDFCRPTHYHKLEKSF